MIQKMDCMEYNFQPVLDALPDNLRKTIMSVSKGILQGIRGNQSTTRASPHGI